MKFHFEYEPTSNKLNPPIKISMTVETKDEFCEFFRRLSLPLKYINSYGHSNTPYLNEIRNEHFLVLVEELERYRHQVGIIL